MVDGGDRSHAATPDSASVNIPPQGQDQVCEPRNAKSSLCQCLLLSRNPKNHHIAIMLAIAPWGRRPLIESQRGPHRR